MESQVACWREWTTASGQRPVPRRLRLLLGHTDKAQRLGLNALRVCSSSSKGHLGADCHRISPVVMLR